MPTTIYATFELDSDAERAAGATLDHGVPKSAISIIAPERFGADEASAAVASARRRFTVADPILPLPPPLPELPRLHSIDPVYRIADDDVAAGRFHYDALGAVIPDRRPHGDSAVHHERRHETLPADASEVEAHDGSAHIIDMNRVTPHAATGVSTTTAGDAAKGAIEGAGVGLGLGLLLGLAAIVIPGVGLVAGTGALVAGLTAATGAAGGVAGGVAGYLADMGVPGDTAKHIGTTVDKGGIALIIEVPDTVSTSGVIELLRKYSASTVELSS